VVAAVGLGGGGALVTAAATAGGLTLLPVIGWVLGAGLLITGMVFWSKADKAVFTPMNYWLNDCLFGKNENLTQRGKKSYPALNEELRGFFNASYGLQWVGKDWDTWFQTDSLQWGSVPRRAGKGEGGSD
jgi:hypothetical protein